MTGETPDATVLDTRAAVLADGAEAAASVRTGPSWAEATDAVLADLEDGAPADLALVFVDSRFGARYPAILERVRGRLAPAHLIGCSGQAVIGPGREAEDEPGVAVMTLRLPGAALVPLTVLPGVPARMQLEALLASEPSALLVFSDPFSVQTERLIDVIEERAPDLLLLGGAASAHDGEGGTALFLDGEVYPAGAVLLAVAGGVEIRTLVAQGAEPIGKPWTITACDQNLVQTIGNRPAVDVLRHTLMALDPQTRERAQRSLLVGLAIDEYRDYLGRGDFLIRNLLGFNAQTGAIAINANVRMGQTLQFQFRDAEAADADLRLQLDALRADLGGRRALGALLCTCNGRGRALFDAPDHDARAIADSLGPLPTAGLFCNGEIGPVGGKPFLHGFTASIGLFVTAPGAETAEIAETDDDPRGVGDAGDSDAGDREGGEG